MMGRKVEKESSIDSDGDEASKTNERKGKRDRKSPDQGYNGEFKDLKTPNKNHGCTDILCTILFIVFLLAFIGLSIFAYINGKPTELILPHDSYGLKCGKDKDVADKKFLLFFDLTKCIRVSAAFTGCPTPQVCVEKCPESNLFDAIESHRKEIRDKYCYMDPYQKKTVCPTYVLESRPVFGRCVPDILAKVLNKTADFALNAFDSENNKNVTIQVTNDNGSVTDLTFDIINKGVKYITNLLNLKRGFELAYEDFENSVWLILVALVIGMILSFIWIILLRCIVKPVVYISIVVVLLLLAFASYFCVSYYLDIRKTKAPSLSDSDFSFSFDKILDLNYVKSLKETWLALSIISCISFAILFLIILFLRKRIVMAVNLIKESSKAITSLPSTLFWPIIPFLLQIGVIAYAASTAVFLASAGIALYKIVDKNATNTTIDSTNNYTFNVGDLCDPKKFNVEYADTNYECVYYKFGYNSTYPLQFGSSIPHAEYVYAKIVDFLSEYQVLTQFFVAFMFFWLSAFLIALNEMTLAGSFGIWYWTRYKNADKRRKNNLPTLTLLRSFGRAIFFHLGTLAFGSLIIAILRLIRLLLEYFERKIKKATNNNRVVGFFMKCMKCCMCCVEKLVKYINHNAYIICAVYGSNFCVSAAKAFKLVVNNIIRVAVIDKLTNFLLFLSKLAIAVAIGVLSFYFFTKKIPIESVKAFAPDLHYYFLPVAVIFIGVYAIAKLFFDVYSMCVDTLFLSALIDLEINDGSAEKPYFMSKDLKNVLDVKNKPKD